MQEILNIVNEIQGTSSRNEKEDLLRKYINNELFKTILQFVYNPFIVTGISDKKINKKTTTVGLIIKDINGMMEFLKIHNTGSDCVVASVQMFIKSQPVELQELLTQIATKSLKLGITSNTMNKIYGKDFIPSFSVMLAEKYFEQEDKVTSEFIVTQKLDGIRCVIIKEKGSLKVFSRQGQPIDDLVEILEEANWLMDDMVYDGELILKNDKGLASKDLYRETVKVARKDGIKKSLIFNCFDIIPVEDFKKGICNSPCYQRKNQIKLILNVLAENIKLQHIVEVPILYQGKDKSNIMYFLDQEIALEHEGVMVNISDAPYECKRSRSILKVKKFNDADVRVLHILEGTGRNIDKLGAVTIQFENQGKLWECNCGSGFSDEERIKYWERPGLILGKIVTIGYFEVSENQKGGVGLRFPTWKGIIREDKDEISMY